MLDEREGPVPAEEQPRAFNRRPVPHRIAVLAAGPVFNFLFAIAAYWAMFIVGVPGLKPIVGSVTDQSVAQQAGLQPQDEIVAVGARETQTWEGAIFAILDELLADGEIDMTVKSQEGDIRRLRLDVRGREAELTEPDALFVGLGLTPLTPVLPPVIGELTAGAPAARAGLREGDRILSADGDPITRWSDLVAFVRARPNRTVVLDVVRAGERLTVELTVGAVREDGMSIGRIGAGVDTKYAQDLTESLSAEQRYGVFAALQRGAAKTWDMSTLTLRMLSRMVTGDVSVKNLSGPIRIAEYAGNSAAAGVSAFFQFLAIVSISLGILNLMPVPLLDGGQIVYQLVEWVKGSPLSERAMLMGQQVGIAVLLLIMSLAFYNDLASLF
jgi:regulator of sigma E protease